MSDSFYHVTDSIKNNGSKTYSTQVSHVLEFLRRNAHTLYMYDTAVTDDVMKSFVTRV